jgi:hypothetical protein
VPAELATAKAGAVHFTRCLADQLRPYNVCVNAIAPGDTRTERFLATRTVETSRLAEEGSLDRIAMVDEVARVVEFFAGPLSSFVSGQVLRVDGAGQCWPHRAFGAKPGLGWLAPGGLSVSPMPPADGFWRSPIKPDQVTAFCGPARSGRICGWDCKQSIRR